MKQSAIILSGGKATRFGRDKGLFKVFEKPLVSYIVERVTPLVDEIIIVCTRNQQQEYSRCFQKQDLKFPFNLKKPKALLHHGCFS